jgi:hypothetical protein
MRRCAKTKRPSCYQTPRDTTDIQYSQGCKKTSRQIYGQVGSNASWQVSMQNGTEAVVQAVSLARSMQAGTLAGQLAQKYSILAGLHCER